jgi:HK97 family phage major capsid protein
MKTKTIETGIEFRALEFQKKTIDKKNRTVEVRFSSEYPVQRFRDGVVGFEILDHSPESVDLGRLNDGAPVLMDHDDRDIVGVVEQATIDNDRVGRALLRFGKSQRASDVFADVVDGVRRSVSMGYRVLQYAIEKGAEEIIFRVQKWEPFEVTFTSIAADPTAQVGRASDLKFKTEVITMDQDKNKSPVSGDTLEGGDTLEDVRRQELDRIANIRKAGEKYDCEDIAKRAIDKGWTVDQMNQAVLDTIAEKQSRTDPVTKIGMSDSEQQSWSLMRAINAAYSNDWKHAGLELEASRAIEDQLQRAPNGFYIPYEMQHNQQPRYEDKRVMTVGTDSLGGYMKATEVLASSFIDLLRANVLLGRLNARFLPGLVGDVDIPRLDGGVAFNWVTEDADATPDDATLGVVALAPKTVVGEVPISRRLLKQSTPSVEQMLMDDMAKGAALAIDLAGFSGTGAAGQPTGITVAAGVGTSTITVPGNPDRDEMIDFETDVLTANALMGTLAYVTTAPVQGLMKNKNIDTGSGKFLMEGGQVNGYDVHISTQLAANTIIFGNYEDVIIGLWGVLDVEPDRAEKAAAGGLVLRVFQDVDIGIRHAGSFSKNA